MLNPENPWKQVYPSYPVSSGKASTVYHPWSLLFPDYTGDSPLQGTNQCPSVDSQPPLLTNQEVLTAFAISHFSTVVSIFDGF